MSRAINIISQIIKISEKAKNELLHNKTSSAIKLLKIIVKSEEDELREIKNETDSLGFYNECCSIYKLTKEKLNEKRQKIQIEELIEIFDRIIALKKHELDIVKAKEGLSEDILRTVDPFIKGIIADINRLSFVKNTEFSCSGHHRPFIRPGYITIIYDKSSKTSNLIKHFHNGICRILGFEERVAMNESNILENYVYRIDIKSKITTAFDREKYKEYLLGKWTNVRNFVRKFADIQIFDNERLKTIERLDPNLLKGYIYSRAMLEKMIANGNMRLICAICNTQFNPRTNRVICPKCKSLIFENMLETELELQRKAIQLHEQLDMDLERLTRW